MYMVCVWVSGCVCVCVCVGVCVCVRQRFPMGTHDDLDQVNTPITWGLRDHLGT